MHEPSVMIVVIDTSGSMREHGKALLARNLVAYVREHKHFGEGRSQFAEPIVILWGPEVSVVRLRPDQELSSFPVGGRAQAQPLLKALEDLLGTDAPRVLLISDGHLAASDVTAFKAWQRRHPEVSIRALAVGPDAVPSTLSRVAEAGGVFPADEIVAAVDSWLLPRELPLPARLVDVVDQAAQAGEQR